MTITAAPKAKKRRRMSLRAKPRAGDSAMEATVSAPCGKTGPPLPVPAKISSGSAFAETTDGIENKVGLRPPAAFLSARPEIGKGGGEGGTGGGMIGFRGAAGAGGFGAAVTATGGGGACGGFGAGLVAGEAKTGGGGTGAGSGFGAGGGTGLGGKCAA